MQLKNNSGEMAIRLTNAVNAPLEAFTPFTNVPPVMRMLSANIIVELSKECSLVGGRPGS